MIHRSLLLDVARNSPATARAAASEPTSAKPTKSATTASAPTETSASPGSAAISGAPDPRSSAAARSDGPTKEQSKDKSQHRRQQEDNKNEQPHDARHWKRMIRLQGRSRRPIGRFQRDSSIRGNNRGDSFGEQSHCAVVIVPLEKTNHFAAETTHLAVRKNGLQPVADLHSILVVIRREQDQDSAILLLRSDPPLRGQINGKLLDGLAFQRRNGHDGDLRSRFAIDLGAKCRQLCFRSRTEHAREVIYITLRFEVLDLLRSYTSSAKNKKQKEK